MCGIVGYVGPRDCSDVLVSALTRLEYRGYDSAGIAVFENGKIEVAKTKGRLKDLSEKFKYQAITVQDIKITNRGKMNIYGKSVPYAKFEAHVTKLPFSDISGVIASVTTSDGSEKLALSVSEKKKYSQLITNEFYRGVKETEK